MLLCGYIGSLQALSILGNEWNMFGFFLGLMSISALAEQAGIFEAVAQVAARRAGGSAEGHPFAGPASVGHVARFVLDHAPCDVLLLRS